MADAKRCERCGNYYVDEEKEFRVNKKKIGYMRLCTPEGNYVVDKKYDLCDQCSKDLWSWLCNDSDVVLKGE